MHFVCVFDPWPPAFCLPPTLTSLSSLSLSSRDLAKAQLKRSFSHRSRRVSLQHPPLLTLCQLSRTLEHFSSSEKVVSLMGLKSQTATQYKQRSWKQRTLNLIGINRLIPTFDPPHTHIHTHTNTTTSYAPLHMVKCTAISIITNL